jgi:plastocyanin
VDVVEYPQAVGVHRASARPRFARGALIPVLGLCLAILRPPSAAATAAEARLKTGPFFLPSGDATKIVSVTAEGEAAAGITIVTEAVAIKERGPATTIRKFGEVYVFSPDFLAVHRDQPTQIEFWNLQPDDEHDFALVGDDLKILMYEKLPPLHKTSWVFSFHREGVINFKCLRHQPAMSGQILVLPPVSN